MCPQQYFFEYVLGWKSPSNKKADKGTIVHKVLEILAEMKHCVQLEKNFYDDDIYGKIDLKEKSMFDDKFILELIDKIYTYYSSHNNHHVWEEKDKIDCIHWVQKALIYNNRMFDPRLRDIIKSEQHFDILINKPWADYKYKTQQGILEGKLAIKGTIDLVTRVNDSTLEIIDYKTGKRLDWATGQEKTQEKLEKDPQLMIYFYAASKTYPEYENIIISIHYINDGGTFSICYNREDIYEAEQLIRKKFEEIKNTNKPRLNRSWKCNKLCMFGKTTFENTDIDPLLEYRDEQITNKGSCMSKCEQLKHDTDLYDIDYVVNHYTVPGYNIAKYKAPGSIE
jgi:CRISPR/Cas system-associated exonuclease Cas4 (RecB family)